VRFLICALLSLVAPASLAVAGDAPSDPNRASFLTLAAKAPPGIAADPWLFFRGYRPNNVHLIDIQDIRRWRGFKTFFWLYTGVAARESFLRDGGFKWKKIRLESPVNESFTLENGQEVVVIPRWPMVAFPLKEGTPVKSVLAVRIIGDGAVITYSRTFGPPRPRRH